MLELGIYLYVRVRLWTKMIFQDDPPSGGTEFVSYEYLWLLPVRNPTGPVPLPTPPVTHSNIDLVMDVI